MKKIMLYLAAIFMVAGAQAAYVAWNINNVYDSTGATPLAGGSVYLFVVSGTTADTTWVAGLANQGAEAVANAITSHAGYTLNYTMKDGATAGSYGWANADSYVQKSNADMGMTGAQQYTLYAVVFDQSTISDDAKFFVTGTRAAAANADTSSATKTWTLSAANSQSPSNWKSVSDVPEPTSGLLLLVGGALLALRRKQK